MHLIEWEGAVWIQVVQDREKLRVFVNSVFNFGSRQVLVLTNGGKSQIFKKNRAACSLVSIFRGSYINICIFVAVKI